MIYIFDSYDCSGKTTLAKAYSKKYNIPLYLDGKSQRPEFKSHSEHRLWAQSSYQYLTRLVVSGVEIDMIVDRLMMTEYCYAPVLRGYDIRHYYKKIEDALASTGKVVWIFPYVGNLDVLKTRYVGKGEDYLTFKNLLKVKDNFENLFSSTKYPGMAIDTSCSPSGRFNTEAIVKSIKWFTDAIKEG